jgi:hypothetical protein
VFHGFLFLGLLFYFWWDIYISFNSFLRKYLENTFEEEEEEGKQGRG